MYVLLVCVYYVCVCRGRLVAARRPARHQGREVAGELLDLGPQEEEHASLAT